MDFILLLFVVFGNSAQADSVHYSIDDQNLIKVVETGFVQPVALTGSLARKVQESRFNLLRWMQKAGPMEEPADPYDRRSQFGGWVQVQRKDCRNTRAWILATTSQVPVTYKPPRNCVVETGEWSEPYTGKVVTAASDLQIDHFVPLKNAYVSGAWRWSVQDRCQYANFLGSDEHLLAVDGHENMSKGDQAPDSYLPPREEFVCEYVKRWLTIKMTWKLEMSEKEARGIAQVLQAHACPKDLMVITEKQLQEVRGRIPAAPSACLKRGAASGS